MIRIFLAAGLAMALPAHSEPLECHLSGCPTTVRFTSISDHRSYGLLIAAPEAGCRHVRFQVQNDHDVFLGHTPPLGPGELAVVRLGRGFPPGDTRVTVASIGCETPPAAIRRVVLSKAGPDYGWRASGD